MNECERYEAVEIDLEGKDIDPRAVADAILAIDALITSLRPDGAHTLRLSGLHFGSAHVEVKAPSSEVNALNNGLQELTVGPTTPDGWNRKTLTSVVDLGNVTKRHGMTRVVVQIDGMISRIDKAIHTHAADALGTDSKSLGSIRGVLYRYTNDERKHRRTAGLRDYRTGEAVEVTFQDHLAAEFREHLETQVEIWGMMDRDSSGKPIRVAAEGIESVETGEPVSAAAMIGAFGKDWTCGLGPVGWVRAQRD